MENDVLTDPSPDVIDRFDFHFLAAAQYRTGASCGTPFTGTRFSGGNPCGRGINFYNNAFFCRHFYRLINKVKLGNLKKQIISLRVGQLKGAKGSRIRVKKL
jgi:hypothetical protein